MTTKTTTAKRHLSDFLGILNEKEADSVQSTNPDYGGGHNKVSLRQTQQNFLEFGACRKDMLQHIRKPKKSDIKDSKWKPVVN